MPQPLPRSRHALVACALALLPLGAAAETLRIGVTSGPHAEIFAQVSPIAERHGLSLELVEFDDFFAPNPALDAGELHANSFQHQPFLDNQVDANGYDIVSVGLTVNFPLSVFSDRHGAWEDLPEGATIAIPDDATNGGRALLLLQGHGALTLAEGVGLTPTPDDIIENPRGLQFRPVGAAETPAMLAEVDAAAVNANFAQTAGLAQPDAILRDSATGPYANIIAVRSTDAGADWVATLLAAYHSPEVRAFVEERFEGAVVPSW